MKSFEIKYPSAKGFRIDKVTTDGLGPGWENISMNSEVSEMRPNSAIVVYFFDSFGKEHRAGFNYLGTIWSEDYIP
ncbi:MAG: hypothetical protein ACHQUB_01245 [Candidatus Saccharimonadia bacterium]